ncbi:PREDICTED: cation/H(+) antiporter 5 [Tarenaya hassleriana]|uniref:cation/H(+) antiporter 5 n=1 Tax=Tarenaya hassleriana TaxID=28532 RepID=UPI00053C3DFB|nr:PREDICTED: cation/H(+) antiporter 5 [Tarenaya hassleriana]
MNLSETHPADASDLWNDLESRGYGMYYEKLLFCEQNPMIVNSHGVWERMTEQVSGLQVWQYSLPLLEIACVLVLVLWQLFHFSFKKLGLRIPKFTSMMLAGAALSQVSLMNDGSTVRQMLFPDDRRPKVAETVGAFAFTLYWFLEGVKMDFGMISRQGPKAIVTGITTIILPIMVANMVFGQKRQVGTEALDAMEIRVMIFMQSISAFTGISRLLRDLKINHTEFGRIALSSAMVADIVSFAINLLALMMWTEKDKITNVYWQIGGALGFIMVMIWGIRPAMFMVIRRTPEGRPVNNVVVYSIILLAFLAYNYFGFLELLPAMGPFIVGLAIPHGPPIGSMLVQRFECINTGILLPLFVFFGMLQVDGPWLIRQLQGLSVMRGQFFEVTSLVFVIFTVKFIASTIPPFFAKMPLKDSIILALILTSKGIIELAYYMYAVEVRIISPKTFTTMTAIILLCALFQPILINYLYDSSKRFVCYQKRNVMSLKFGSEVRVLVCIYQSHHITSMIKLLVGSFTSGEFTLACFVLHLVELVGQDNPLFISHKMQKPKPGSTSLSANVIVAFTNFKQNFWKSVSVDSFTSVSIPRYMDQEIAQLALEKVTSFILLPFHRTWSYDQTTLLSDDNTIRNVNLNILRRAPCSVGIFVHREYIRPTPKTHHPSLKICAVFVGGRDDREALALAKRMAQKREVSLTVLRLVPASMAGKCTGWDQMLDAAELREVVMRNNNGGDQGDQSGCDVEYMEERVADGSETSRVLMSAAKFYELFVVGRGSGLNSEVTAALGDWVEFEELGVIGDLLVSRDFPHKASVLVVQQQQNVAVG